ncbi:MAG: HSP90 family protein [Propionibacteriaceae bacterium]|nr:HSP90 family protein [Propionibacteriaceae bacterium]
MAEVFRVDLGGMVELLSRNLYSGPRVFVRELLQNATDAITARQETEPGLAGRIRFITDGATLSVVDNGVGITHDEAGALLATIGATSKRDVLGLARTDRLGQFGIGLLSCFMVSEEIVVQSRSVTGAPAIEWVGRSDGTWEVRTLEQPPSELADFGTVMRLRALPGERWFAPGILEELLRSYGEFLPSTVMLESPHSTVITEEPPVWEQAPAEQARWCAEHFGFMPLAVVPLHARAGGVRGAAFVLPDGAHPGRATRHQVYVRRMLLSDKVTDLLPEWAYFVRAVVDTQHLRPTAARESLFDDDLLEQTREELGAQVREWLHALAKEQPREFQAFLSAHETGLKAMALTDEATRQLVADAVPWETTVGPRTLNQLAATGMIRYAPTPAAFRSVAAVAEANQLCVVNGGYVYGAELLEQFALDRPDVSVREIGLTEILGALTPLELAEEAWFLTLVSAGRAALSAVDTDVVVRRFKPSTMPVVYLDGTAQFADRLAAKVTEADGSLAGLLDALRPPAAQAARAQLVLNADAPLIYQLAGISDANLLTHAVRGLYVQGLLAGQYPLGPQARVWAAGSFESLISSAVERNHP